MDLAEHAAYLKDAKGTGLLGPRGGGGGWPPAHSAWTPRLPEFTLGSVWPQLVP